jgi:hypothetical protein
METRRRRATTLGSTIPFFLYLVGFALLASRETFSVAASSQAPEIVTPQATAMSTEEPPADIRVVFSDVDGTLVHYPKESSSTENEESGNRILKLPPSATGMQGIISSRTLEYCRDVRHDKKLVLISGMRTTTLLKRLPYLPRADAYCTSHQSGIF